MNINTLQVFDPAMCCSTGVCGPQVDTQLVQFASDLDWLRSQGVVVKRHNLSHRADASKFGGYDWRRRLWERQRMLLIMRGVGNFCLVLLKYLFK